MSARKSLPLLPDNSACTGCTSSHSVSLRLSDRTSLVGEPVPYRYKQVFLLLTSLGCSLFHFVLISLKVEGNRRGSGRTWIERPFSPQPVDISEALANSISSSTTKYS